MPKGPTRAQIKTAMEAAQYREHMHALFRRRGMSETEARRKAEEATDSQLAIRLSELEKARKKKTVKQAQPMA